MVNRARTGFIIIVVAIVFSMGIWRIEVMSKSVITAVDGPKEMTKMETKAQVKTTRWTSARGEEEVTTTRGVNETAEAFLSRHNTTVAADQLTNPPV